MKITLITATCAISVFSVAHANPSMNKSLGIAKSLLQFPGYRSTKPSMGETKSIMGIVTDVFNNRQLLVKVEGGGYMFVPASALELPRDLQVTHTIGTQDSPEPATWESPTKEDDYNAIVEKETLTHAIGQYLSIKLKVLTTSMRSCVECLRDKLTDHTATLENSFSSVEEEIAHTLAKTENIGEAILLDVTTAAIQQLIARGANVERRDGNGRTALMLAALLGKWREMSILLEAGAKLNAQDDAGNTALHLAVDVGHHEATALLIARGADTSAENNANLTPINLARESEDGVLLELLQTAQQPQNLDHTQDLDIANRLLQRAAAYHHNASTETKEEQTLLD